MDPAQTGQNPAMAKRKRKPAIVKALSDPRVAGATVAAAAAAGVAAAGKVRLDRTAQDAEDRQRRFRLDGSESAPAGIRRIARGQVDYALDSLRGGAGDGLAKGIHEARKSFKRMRALARLGRDELGDETYRRENETYRDAGRSLSGMRDAKVMVATLDGLRKRFRDEIPDGAFEGLRAALVAEHGDAVERVTKEDDSVRVVTEALESARDRIAAWPLDESKTSYDVLTPGFERIYRRGRKAMRAAHRDTTTEALHDLRKRTKDLWHAAQIVRPVAPKEMKKLARRAHDLADVIGDDHDLAVLSEAAAARQGTLAQGELELLRGLVDRRRARLQREALKRSKRLYGRKPRAVARPLAAA
jgi:CHAD domain-containing protein